LKKNWEFLLITLTSHRDFDGDKTVRLV
jgi:hypothetical protein